VIVSWVVNKTFNPLKAINNPKKGFSNVKNTTKNYKIINKWFFQYRDTVCVKR